VETTENEDRVEEDVAPLDVVGTDDRLDPTVAHRMHGNIVVCRQIWPVAAQWALPPLLHSSPLHSPIELCDERLLKTALVEAELLLEDEREEDERLELLREDEIEDERLELLREDDTDDELLLDDTEEDFDELLFELLLEPPLEELDPPSKQQQPP
jgi:hypothetical protein